MRILIFVSLFFLTGCLEFLDAKTLFGISESTKFSLTFDMKAGRYNPLPTSLAVTFPSGVDMSTVLNANFTITETCTGSDPVSFLASKSGQVATITISNTGGCANGEYFKLTVDFTGMKSSDDQIGSGTSSYTYTLDTSAPSVSVAVKTLSGITASNAYTFSSAPTSLTYTFSSDVDMSAISASTFVVSSVGLDCSTMPTASSVTKTASTGAVKLNLTGGVCNTGESFRVSLIANSVGDSTIDGSTGSASPNYGPALNIDIDVTVDSTNVSVVDVGGGGTSSTGTYGVASAIDVEVAFDGNVDVTGTPKLKLNTSPVKYATYTSGTGTSTLVFRYTVAYGDSATDLDYSSTTALQLNSGTITKTGSGGAVNAVLTLPSPGTPGSLGDNRDIVIDTAIPIITASSPSGTTDTWGQSSRTISFTMSEEIDLSSLADTDLTINGTTCGSPPTVASSYLTGGTNNVINFDLSTTACTNGQVYTMTFDPTHVTDLSSNAGYGTTKTITVTLNTAGPSITVGAPSKTYINASGTTKYVVTYSGATSVTLADTDLNFAGASTGCAAVVSGTGTATRTITISTCADDGAVQMDIASGTAVNAAGNYSAAVAEAAITDFNADNTELPDPTTNLPTYKGVEVYNKDTLANIGLTFAGDVLGTSGAISSALLLECDSGSGPMTVSQSTSRSNNTLATLTPNEASPDFIYAATCTISGTAVPDSAGNTHDFVSPLSFTVGRNLIGTSGPSGSISRSTADGTGDLGDVVFNVPVDVTTLDNTNVTLTCGGQNIVLTSLPTSNGDLNVTIDYDENDANWMGLSGTVACTLSFATAVTNSLGIPLASTLNYNFSTTP